MRLYLASWIMVGGIMTALTGCGWKEISNNKSTMVGNAIDTRMQPDPAMAAKKDGVGRPDDYSPKDAVKSTIADLHAILGNEALKQPARLGLNWLAEPDERGRKFPISLEEFRERFSSDEEALEFASLYRQYVETKE